MNIVNIILGIILLLTFVGLVWYCIKGYNIMVGFFVLAVIWSLIAMIGFTFQAGFENTFDTLGKKIQDLIKTVFQNGPAGYASSILVNVFFGAFFGKILVESNVVSTLIRKVVELGGDKPRIIITFLSIVVALLFTSMTGIGPAISIAVIVIPILLTLGIPAYIALFSLVGAMMAGIFANITNFIQYIGIFGADKIISYQDYSWLGWTGLVVSLVVVLIVTNVALSISKRNHSWAAKMPQSQRSIKNKKRTYIVQPAETITKVKTAPWYSWIGVLLPVILVISIDMPVILAFILAGIYVLITCGKLKGGFQQICRTLSKLFTDGAIDVAPMVGFLLALAMFTKSAEFVSPYFEAIFGGLIPNNIVAVAIVLFAILSPLGFFRGPLNLAGAGPALLGVLKASLLAAYFNASMYTGSQAEFNKLFLGFGLFAITTVAPMHLDVTLSWVAWGLGYTKVQPRQHLKLAVPAATVVCIIMVGILISVSFANGSI